MCATVALPRNHEVAEPMQCRASGGYPMRNVVLTLLLVGCSNSPGTSGQTLSSDEALTSVNETATNNQASQLASASIDVSTKFALGVDAQTAIAQIAAYVANKLP